MSYLENQIAEVEAQAIKQIDYGRMILNILDSIDLSPRCSAINNEHLYSATELEAIFKIRRDKKEQFQQFLETSMEAKNPNSGLEVSICES